MIIYTPTFTHLTLTFISPCGQKIKNGRNMNAVHQTLASAHNASVWFSTCLASSTRYCCYSSFDLTVKYELTAHNKLKTSVP